MKSFVPELSRSDMVELVDEQRKEYRLIGSQRRIPGLILFEYDLTTGELRRASMKKEVQLTIGGTIIKNTTVNSKDLCLYIQSLNEENAMRKVHKMLRRKSTRESLLKHQKNG